VLRNIKTITKRRLRLGSQSGFTLPELTMSIVVLGIIVVGMLGVFTNFLVITTRSNLSLDLAVDSQSLLRSLSEELRYGAGVRQSNINPPSDSWNTSNANFVIITTIPVVDGNNNYIIDTSTGKPYLNEHVYFKQGSELYRRILVPSPNPTGNTKKSTCPASIASSSCPADTKLADYMNSMDFELYDQDNNLTTTASSARSIKITLTLSRDTYGEPVSMTNSIRTTLRNNFQ
jgi:prepilin-type N-terminal cleavage/methylation domain-containing protein